MYDTNSCLLYGTFENLAGFEKIDSAPSEFEVEVSPIAEILADGIIFKNANGVVPGPYDKDEIYKCSKMVMRNNEFFI